MIHGNRLTFLQISAIYNQCFSNKLFDRELVKRRSSGKKVCRWIHMRSRMCVHL